MGAKSEWKYEGEDGLEAAVQQLGDRSMRVVVRSGGERVSWRQAIDGLRGESNALRALLSQVLVDLPFRAAFWECPPVSAATADAQLFEFVALDAPHLAAIDADAEPFSEHLDEYAGQPIARTFANLGGDSLLVAPARHAEDEQVYAHLLNFFRGAPEEQCQAQWRELANAVDRRLQQSRRSMVWVSTEGSGVYWLHMRLDPRPKYYHHGPYRRPDFQSGAEL